MGTLAKSPLSRKVLKDASNSSLSIGN